ncbi:7651_t:CDS:2 [Gigaspora margarita]|uniref:7651_t:CDS:1 n=1 Tax=Gigaspora margarita TaxID=4874 RepID=A0ABN7UNY7_GIGMA|nr:7651_t:CDS:2 [Gigaspora margarita]
MSKQLNISFYYEKRIGTSKSKVKKKATKNYKSSEQNEVEPIPEISVNAVAQKSVANAIEIAKKKTFKELQTQVKANKNRIFKLKRNAKYSQNCTSSPTWVSVASVSHTETHEYPDTYYCFVFIKYAKQFASFFADISIIISQDDKTKIGLGVSAIS